MSLPSSLRPACAPTGALRASINLGNPLLAGRDAGTGEVKGVSVDLARGLAERLGVALELVVLEKAMASVQAVAEGDADIGFFAVDPQRGQEIAFSAPYLLIEGSYLVREDSPIRANDEVDRPGLRVMVGQGSAYDLFLTRALRQAEVVRAPNSQAVVDQFLAQGQEVAAGVRQQLEADAAGRPGLRLLPGCFMLIAQAMGVAKARGPEAVAALAAYVEEMKTSGFVARALERHGARGASVAP